MTTVNLTERLDEISMLLGMTDDADRAGLGMIGELFASLGKEALVSDAFQKITAAAEAAQTLISSGTPGITKALGELLDTMRQDAQISIPDSIPVSAGEHTASERVQDVRDETSLFPPEYQISGEIEILVEFAAEAEEHLSKVEEVILESGGSFTKDAIDTIFRGVHSLKGGSAYFNLDEITRTSHLLESLLDEVRSDKREFDDVLNDLVLRYIDLQKNLIKTARAAAAGNGVVRTSPDSDVFLRDLTAYAEGGVVQERVAMVPAAQTAPSAEPIHQEEGRVPVARGGEPAKQAEGAKDTGKSFVKIETARLDHLIDSIGEMAIYSTMLVRMCREQLGQSETVLKTTTQVEKFARDLQEIGMSMRLMPIKGLFQKMARLVHDTGKKLGKDIVFEMHGEDTELDRNIIDKLADPLMHMVRNSIDHGVEMPEVRTAAGKSAQGRVKLSAYRSGATIHVAIEDDGKGLDPEMLTRKAVEKGILPEGAKLSDNEAYNLIFAPGFSTAAAVTDVSGRGVGMDVVKRNVEALRGHILISSEKGQGSKFIIEIPLTLAMVDGIEIRVGRECFIIPSLSIIEFIKPEKRCLSHTLDQGETFYFRGKYLPIFRLSELYGIEPLYTDPTQGTLIVVENNHEQVALMVDDIVGEYSTVIKSLGSVFQDGKGISGCAIMPDGSVALILDVRQVVQLARTGRHG